MVMSSVSTVFQGAITFCFLITTPFLTSIECSFYWGGSRLLPFLILASLFCNDYLSKADFLATTGLGFTVRSFFELFLALEATIKLRSDGLMAFFRGFGSSSFFLTYTNELPFEESLMPSYRC